MDGKKRAFDELNKTLNKKKEMLIQPFSKFLEESVAEPEVVFRDIFQLFYDTIHYYIPEGKDEYPSDPESIHYVKYDCTGLFVEGVSNPFFADRLFANRLINLANSFKRGLKQNKIYLFYGPKGSGKSTFLNNLLCKFEEFLKKDEGKIYETIWKINLDEIEQKPKKLENLLEHNFLEGERYIEIPCPNHDNPILNIPKEHRKNFIDNIFSDENVKSKLFNEKEYEWVLKKDPCTICFSIYQSLLEKFDEPKKVLDMLFVRRFKFNRKLGEGIGVYNSGDIIIKKPLENPFLQEKIDRLFKDSNKVRYIFSRLAKTNNGIYALMDIKEQNKTRFKDLYGIVSEGVHRVDHFEENINSIFIGLMNPEDDKIIESESFQDRIERISIPYVLDYKTEVEIYKNKFGENIEKLFLPRVLDNFAKIIISSRLNRDSETIKEWIADPKIYRKYCDENLLLLKMDFYTGLIPEWLSEKDKRNLNAKNRRKIIEESEFEGRGGFSGRKSILIFNEFYSMYSKKNDGLIEMKNLWDFFIKKNREMKKEIPEGFLKSLVKLYGYNVVQEMKESMYDYNEEKISRDIQNYLFATNFNIGDSEKCNFTGDVIKITEDFFNDLELKFLGEELDEKEKENFRKGIHQEFVSKTLTREIGVERKKITETLLYNSLYEKYKKNIKKNALNPFLNNENFRTAVKNFGNGGFKESDKRIQEEVMFLINNLKNKFGYTIGGAKQVCMYVIDRNLVKEYEED